MIEPELRLLNVKGLIENLNSTLASSEGQIELGDSQHKEPRKNPFLYRLEDKKLEVRGKYSLYRTRENGGLFSNFFGLDSERRIGYVFIENGEITESINFPGIYETLRLRIKEPLILKNSLIVPNCSVKILAEVEDGIEPYLERRDNIRKIGLFWKKADLSKVLPTEWFLNYCKQNL